MDAARRPICPGRAGRLAAATLGVLLSAWPASTPAQPPSRDIHYTRQPLIRIPFTPDTSGRLKKVLLYVSTDQGRDWQPCSEAAPTDRYFRWFTPSGDGTYWFAVLSLDAFNQFN